MGLFGKSETNNPSLPAASSPKPASPSPALPPAATVIGRDAQINGELSSSDNVRVEGKVEGKIRSTKHVIIGENGYVHAEVEAEVVSIRGKLEGDCRAHKKAEITGTGKVFGNISAPVIAVAEGAIFRGSSRMSEAKTTVALKPGGAAGLPPVAKEPKKEGSSNG